MVATCKLWNYMYKHIMTQLDNYRLTTHRLLIMSEEYQSVVKSQVIDD
jgi:hypothetical protein